MTINDLGPQHEITGAPDGPDKGRAAGAASVELTALAAVADLSGQVVGPYRVAGRVGGGATAAVYRAVDQITEQPVALKVLLPGADTVARERFRREAQLVSALRHPNIVPTLDIGQAVLYDSVYIAMELVDGPSLAEVLDQVGRLEPLDACRLLVPIARALDYAHQQGVVHRDVKPGNILLRRVAEGDPAGIRLAPLPDPVTPLLTDFGIARALDAPELTSVGRTVGTPAFMAPEQCAGGAEIDGRADVYALGAVLYRCLVGRPPFGGTTTQILHAHVYDPVLVPEEVAARIPPAVLAAVGRALMKEPDKRYADAGTLAQELETFASDCADQVPVAGDDATLTMVSLPATTTQVTRVLVPAPPVTPNRSVPAVTRPPSTRFVPRTPLVPRPSPRRPRFNRPGSLILGSALGLLLVLLATTLIVNLIPEPPAAESGAPAASAASASAAISSTTPASLPAVAVETGQALALSAPSSAAPEGRPAATPAPLPTPVGDPASFWEDAQALFDAREWSSALDKLIYVRRLDPEYRRDRVERMMITAYVALATKAIARQQWQIALQLLDDAMEIRPPSEALRTLRAAVEAVMTATNDERPAARQTLQAALTAYAEMLAEDDNPCAAAEQMNAAILVIGIPSHDQVSRLSELSAACRRTKDAAAASEPGGAILFSVKEQDGVYRIYRLLVGSDATPALLVENGAQPRLSPNGGALAYHGHAPGEVGLFGLNFPAAGGQAGRLTDPSEDAADAPPSWNPKGDRLVFSSNRGDTGYRIYLAWANGTRETTDLGYGKDPAWHPMQDLLVFTAFGEQPGLWLMRTNGDGRTPLTDNGNDQRPVWTPDGTAVVFMSNRDAGNWDLYRVDLDGTTTRLTSHPAQDGLPAISPDGRYVAFMSDRGGNWRLWYMPIEGGEAKPLGNGNLTFSLPSWLEHAMQWVN